ncbi:helix-turn-helix transcriptional regulator [Thermoanaerobacterium sp. RBIITD]|uniref:helix-turn-helix domain-containing protein n=1 Tax=Thermoanaerobacterium sp. RBIITD TaxID=1550240 RepID=UPI000BB763F9|nr:helix-turn-helix transcriptional regulator [Thermoanaerobacterium sp. RBIITD]SNX55313.1 Helix-turn-helix domain-containing protein [Thermoanaerobacterium sp. RBIITD]
MDLYIGTKIKALRLQKKISQSQLCDNFMNRVVLSRIENNKALPSLEQLIHISEKLKVPLSYFINDIKYDELIENDDSSSFIISDLFNNQNYYEIVKLIEYNHDEFSKTQDFNKYYYAGASFFNIGLYNDALKYLKRYVNLFLKSKEDIQKQNIDNFCHALNILFKIMLKNRNYEKGINYLELAKKYLYALDSLNYSISFVIHNNLAYLYLKTNQFQKVINLLESFVNTHDNLIYINAMPHIYMSLNIACYNMGYYEKSIKYIKKAILLFKYYENEFDAARCHLNYINSLRYSGNFDKAFEIVNRCKNEYKKYNKLYLSFFIQEMILYFNIGNYDKVMEISSEIEVHQLSEMSKHNYEFMMGHIKYLHNDFDNAYNLLKKCEKYFLTQYYYGDLLMLYDDLYCITNDISYKAKSNQLINKVGRKNIVMDS